MREHVSSLRSARHSSGGARCRVVAAVLVTVVCFAVRTDAQRFRPDDPISEDPDNLSIPQPTERPLSKTIDLFQKTFRPVEAGDVRAQNTNTLGEVPDSSWFTNRMSRRVMSVEELVRGPNLGDGPDMSELWTIIGAKTEGVTPGLRIRDARGDVYFIKFNPLPWPQMATSSEVIGTKFFHAFGYHVPENYLVRWRPEYTLDPDGEVLWDSGHTERLSRLYVEDLLEGIPIWPDGTTQIVASKLLPGSPLGPFDFQGVRSDDPNDIFLHQDRRELRALQIFCAWLNHNDSDSVNTLDMYYTDDEGRSYARHHLIDFGTVMGSGSILPHARRVGNEYYIEFKPALKAAATFGVWDRPWRHVEYNEYPSVGRFESAYFRPEAWKPDYPNPAFDKMTPQDALWATRTVMRFDDEAVRAIVRTGDYDDPAAEEYVAKALIERRDKIVRYYLSRINPLDGFQIASSRLEFVNLGLDARLATDCQYEYQWHRFNNDTGTLNSFGQPASSSELSVSLPSDSSPFLMVRVTSNCSDQPAWHSAVDVYLRNGDAPSVVGIERADPSP